MGPTAIGAEYDLRVVGVLWRLGTTAGAKVMFYDKRKVSGPFGRIKHHQFEIITKSTAIAISKSPGKSFRTFREIKGDCASDKGHVYAMIKLRLAVHLAFDIFQAIDLPFGLTVAPFQLEGIANSEDPKGYRLPGPVNPGNLCGYNCGQPVIKSLMLTLFHHRDEILNESICLSHFVYRRQLHNSGK